MKRIVALGGAQLAPRYALPFHFRTFNLPAVLNAPKVMPARNLRRRVADYRRSADRNGWSAAEHAQYLTASILL